MQCPMCHTPLRQDGSQLYVCTHGHGVLMAGGYLHSIETAPAHAPAPAGVVHSTPQTLGCPHCGNAMHKVDFNGTGIVIDACMHCPYRWLDAGEAHKIQAFKPQLKPADMLALQALEQKIIEIDARVPDNPDPQANGFRHMGTLSRGGVGQTAGALGAMGLITLVRGLVRSKFLRVAAPIMLVIVGLVYWYVIGSFGK